MRKLLFVFIQPHLDYDLLVWSSVNQSNTKPIKTNGRKKTTRKIVFKKCNEDTEPQFKKLNILDFDRSKLLSVDKFLWQLKTILLIIHIQII